MATNAKNEITTILTRMIGQEIRLARQGYRTRRAEDGYKNEKVFIDGKKKTIQVPDPERAKFFVAMFNLRAQGLPDPEIVKRVNAMGYRSPFQNRYDKEHKKIIGKSGGVVLTTKQLQRIIQRTIYAGVMCEKWTDHKLVRAQYDGLVSIDKWNHANKGKLAIMKNLDGTLELIQGHPFGKSGKERMRNNPLYPYKFILCPFCNKPFLASSPRGKSGKKHPTYHCNRKHKYFGVRKKDFNDNVEKYIKSLKFSSEVLGGLEVTFLAKYRQREKEIVAASGDIHESIADLERQQLSKLEALEAAKSPVVREKLEKAIDDLEEQIKAAGKVRTKIQISRDDIKAFMDDAKKVIEHPAEILLNPSDPRVQKDLFGLVFEKMPTYEEILNGTPKMSYVFELSSKFRPSKGQLVTPQRIEL